MEKMKKRVIGREVKLEEDQERDRFKKLKDKESGGSAAHAVEAPSEEEVEEFFAILRRMKVAVKYFGETGRGGKEWREAVEQLDVTVQDGEEASDHALAPANEILVLTKKDGEVVLNVALDLNVAPEAAQNGGA